MRREQIEQALHRLGARLHARGVTGEVMLVGGAAMCLAYAARQMTRDVDAVFEPKAVVAAEARVVAAEMGLAPDWLNDAAKGFLSPVPPEPGPQVMDLPGLLVWAPTPDYIFAMKCLAARAEDRPDIELLSRLIGVAGYAQAAEIVLRHYPADRLLRKTRFTLEEIFGPPTP